MSVYVIEAVGSGCFKVGMTAGRVEGRRVRMQTGCPHELRVVADFHQLGFEHEQFVHALFACQRVRGEWFRLNDDELDALIAELFALAGGVAVRPPVLTHWDPGDFEIFTDRRVSLEGVCNLDWLRLERADLADDQSYFLPERILSLLSVDSSTLDERWLANDR